MQLSGRNNLDTLRNDILDAMDVVLGKKQCSVDEDFLDLMRKFNSRRKTFRMPDFVKRETTPFIYEHNKRASLLFSGGRISLATALWLKEMGKDVELVYIEDENKQQVESLMSELGLPWVTLASKRYDNEFSAMLLLQDTLEHAVSSHHSPVLYIGCFDNAAMSNNVKKDWRYCQEFINTYDTLVKKYVDGAKVLCLFPDYRVVNDELLKHPEYQYIQ